MGIPSTGMRPKEGYVHQLWQRVSCLPKGLVTQQGQGVQVLYPGRPSAQAGPDFRDAVIRTGDGRLLRGDVELHLEPRGWQSHGHHRDPRYNGVVLHVVLWPKGQATSPQESRLDVPVLAIGPFFEGLEGPGHQGPDPLHRLGQLDDKSLGELLDWAGDERFLAKSTGLAMEIDELGAESTLYQALMESLGYADNRKPFRELARLVPAQLIASFAGEPPGTRLLAIQSLLLSASGLLHCLGHQGQATQLKGLRKRLPRVDVMSPDQWRLFRVRPRNHPARRIIGMAHILNRFIEGGLVKGLLTLVKQGRVAALAQGLMAPPFIGRGRADEMAVNVVLPFFYAWAQGARDHPLRYACVELYNGYPTLPGNQVTREMERLLKTEGKPRLATSARRCQGLMYLYKAFTSPGVERGRYIWDFSLERSEAGPSQLCTFRR